MYFEVDLFNLVFSLNLCSFMSNKADESICELMFMLADADISISTDQMMFEKPNKDVFAFISDPIFIWSNHIVSSSISIFAGKIISSSANHVISVHRCYLVYNYIWTTFI